MTDAVISGIFGAGTAIGNNVISGLMSKGARRDIYNLNEQAAAAADTRTRGLYWDLYAPAAQLKQLKQAGLSPSLMYGDGAGISGQTGAQGAGVSNAPQTFGIDPLTMSQIELNQAQASKLHADASRLNGESEYGRAEIMQMLNDAGLKQAETNYKNSLKAGQDLQNYVSENTKEFQINTAYSLSEKAASDAQKAVFETIAASLNADYLDKTQEERIKSVKINNKLLDAQTLLNKAHFNLSNAEIEKIGAQITVWQNEVAQGWNDIYIKAFNAQNEHERNKIIDDYFDGQIENLNNRLEFDKNKFGREMRFKWSEFITMLMNDNNHKFLDSLMQIIPTFTQKKSNPIGFR